MSNDVSNISLSQALTGPLYTWYATGGFSVKQGYDIIEELPDPTFKSFDVTNAVQILFDVSVFNSHMGLIKDASNIYIISNSWYDQPGHNDEYYPDEITITSSMFSDNVTNTNQIVSLGKLSDIYSDFINYVHAYFGYMGGFASLFTGDTTFDISGGVFNAESFLNLIHGTDTSNNVSAYTTGLTGNITIGNLTYDMRYAVNANIFGNRDPTGADGTFASDPNYPFNFGMIDGFVAGDLIFIPNGLAITLQVNVETESNLPINNYGPLYGQSTATSQDNAFGNTPAAYTDASGSIGTYSQTTTSTTTEIMRVINLPILLRLADFPLNLP